jgi:hypothetical protein
MRVELEFTDHEDTIHFIYVDPRFIKLMTAERDVIKETEWLKIYRVGGSGLIYESKCLSEGLQISAKRIKSTWANLTTKERLEFTIAFGAIPKLSAEDEEILSFLMEAGDDVVWSNLASQYAKHSDRERVLPFLLGRIQPLKETCGNFFQALELLRDTRAVPPLRSTCEAYRMAFEQHQLDQSQTLDYLQCCRALMVLDSSPEFRLAIQHMLQHPVESIRRRAAQLLA